MSPKAREKRIWKHLGRCIMPTRNTAQLLSSGPTILSEKAAAAKLFVPLLLQCFGHAEPHYVA